MSRTLKEIVESGVEPRDILDAIDRAIDEASETMKAKGVKKSVDLFNTLFSYTGDAEVTQKLMEKILAGEIPHLIIDWNYEG